MLNAVVTYQLQSLLPIEDFGQSQTHCDAGSQRELLAQHILQWTTVNPYKTGSAISAIIGKSLSELHIDG